MSYGLWPTPLCVLTFPSSRISWAQWVGLLPMLRSPILCAQWGFQPPSLLVEDLEVMTHAEWCLGNPVSIVKTIEVGKIPRELFDMVMSAPHFLPLHWVLAGEHWSSYSKQMTTLLWTNPYNFCNDERNFWKILILEWLIPGAWEGN